MHYNITTVYGSSSNPILKRNETNLSDIVEETINPSCDEKSFDKNSVFSDLYKYVCKKELENTNFFEYVLFIFFSSGIVCYEINSKILSVLGKIVYVAIKSNYESTETDKKTTSTNEKNTASPKKTEPKPSVFSSITSAFKSKSSTSMPSSNEKTSLLGTPSSNTPRNAPRNETVNTVRNQLIPTGNTNNKPVSQNNKPATTNNRQAPPNNNSVATNNKQAPANKSSQFVGGAFPKYEKLINEGDKKKEKTYLDILVYTLLPIWGLYFVFELITTLVKERFVELNKIFGNKFNKSTNEKLSVSKELSKSFLSLLISIVVGLIVVNCIVYILYLMRGTITSNNSKLSYLAILSGLPFVLASVGINLTVVEGAGKKGDGKKPGLGKAIKKSNKAIGKDIKKRNKKAADKRKKQRQKEKAKSSGGPSSGTSGSEGKPVKCTSYNYIWYFVAYFIIPILVSIYTIIKFFIVGLSGITQIKDIGIGFLYLLAVTTPIIVVAFISALIEYAIAKKGIKLDELNKTSAQFI